MQQYLIKYKRVLLCLVALGLFFLGTSMRSRLCETYSTQSPEIRWSGDKTPYGYISAYIPEEEGVTLDSVLGYRNQMNLALQEASIIANENARLYIDAYSVSGQTEVSRDIKSTSYKVNVTAVGGEYFYMHPMEVLSGNFLSDEDLMRDGVVIDRNTAWSLYGSTNVNGKYVVINGAQFVIVGVVSPYSSSHAEKTYGAKGRIFMHYDTYQQKINTSGITSYEIVYPDWITNYAYNQMKEMMGLAQEDVAGSTIEVVNQSIRFRASNLWKVLTSYGMRSSKTNGITYPYWENEARRLEDFAVLYLIINMVCLLSAIILIIPDGIKLARLIRHKSSVVIEKLRFRFGFK